MNQNIRNHRLGAFVYGFMSGLGLVLMMWGLSSIIALPASSASMSVSLILLGVLLFAGGSCREAYLRGGLSAESSTGEKIGVERIRLTQASKTHDQVLQPASNPALEAQVSSITARELTQENISHDQD